MACVSGWYYLEYLSRPICWPGHVRCQNVNLAIVILSNDFAADIRVEKTLLFRSGIHPEALNILKIDAARVEALKAGLRDSGRFPAAANKNGQN